MTTARRHAVHIACPAQKYPEQGHIRNCDAAPDEPCNHRGKVAETLAGVHAERATAWTALPIGTRRALLVAATLREAARNDG